MGFFRKFFRMPDGQMYPKWFLRVVMLLVWLAPGYVLHIVVAAYRGCP